LAKRGVETRTFFIPMHEHGIVRPGAAAQIAASMRRAVRGLFAKLSPPSPSYSDGRTMRALVRKHAGTGRVLDLGAGARRLAPGVVSADLDRASRPTVVCDAMALPFSAVAFDLVVSTALLEHCPDPHAVVREMHRVLRAGGEVYAEIPFLQGFHPDPADYQRYTVLGIERLFSGFETTRVGVCVGPSSALAWMLGKYAATWFDTVWLARAVEGIGRWVTFPLKYLDALLQHKRQAHTLASALYFWGRRTD